MTREEALRTLSTLADRAKAEGWHTPLPPRERAQAREAITALQGLLAAPAREALLAEGELRWAQVALAAVAPKSRASRRDVPLAPADAARLRRHRLATGRPPDRALLYAAEDGRHLNATGVVRHALRRGCGCRHRLPVPGFTTPASAWATSMLAAGIGAQAVTRLGGWSDAALVHRRYGHALPDELAGAGEALERFREARLAARIGPRLVPAGEGSR